MALLSIIGSLAVFRKVGVVMPTLGCINPDLAPPPGGASVMAVRGTR